MIDPRNGVDADPEKELGPIVRRNPPGTCVANAVGPCSVVSPAFRIIGKVMWSDGFAPSGPNEANAGSSETFRESLAAPWAAHSGTNPPLGAVVVGGEVVDLSVVLVVVAMLVVVDVPTGNDEPGSLHAPAIAASATADATRRHATRAELTT